MKIAGVVFFGLLFRNTSAQTVPTVDLDGRLEIMSPTGTSDVALTGGTVVLTMEWRNTPTSQSMLASLFSSQLSSYGITSSEYGRNNTGVAFALHFPSRSSELQVRILAYGKTLDIYQKPESEMTTVGNWVMERTYTGTGSSSYVNDIEYYDGLGIPEQRIQVGASPSGKSIVTPVYKDDLLRDNTREYLPYEGTQKTAKKQASPFSENRFSPIYGITDQNSAYSETEFESYATDRPVSTIKPGAIYKTNTLSESISYGVNESTENVFRLTSSDSGISIGFPYSTGMLNKTMQTNEDGESFATFTDKLGRQVLHRRYMNETHTSYADTYSVYDDADRLVYSISPEGSAAMLPSSSWSINSDNVKNWCTVYTYDGYGRLKRRRLAGKGWEYFVYDKAGRVVLAQDAELRKQNRWIYTVYDNAGREIEKSIVTGTMPREALQSQYDNENYNNSYPTLGGTSDYRKPGISGITLYKHLSSTRYGGMHYRTSTSGNAVAKFTVPSALAFSNVSTVATTANRDTTSSNLKIYEKIYTFGQQMTTNNYVERAFYYDKKGRVIQTVERNVLGGISRTSVKYDYSGHPLIVREMVKTSSSDTSDDMKQTVYTYDARGRVLTENCTVNSGTAGTVNYAYDGVGRLVSRTYGNGTGETRAYTTQGWLSGLLPVCCTAGPCIQTN